MGATRIHLLSASTALPGPPVGTEKLARHLGLGPDQGRRISDVLGIRTRHLCRDLDGGPPYATLTDLAATAAERALAAADLRPRDVGAILMSTATPDHLMPATVNLVADRLGIDQVPSYQLMAGATGALQTIDLAAQMLSSGRRETVLVIAGEASTKQLGVPLVPGEERARAELDAASLGDGAAAAVVTSRTAPTAYALHRVLVRRDTTGHPPGHTADWLGAAERGTRDRVLAYDRELIAEVVPKLAGGLLVELLDGLGWQPGELARLLPPQLPGVPADGTPGQLAVPAGRCDSRIEEIGHAANPLPLFQLAHAHERTAPGDRIAAVAVDPGGWVTAAIALERV